VIVPAYNAEKYLASTLRSIFAQTFPPFEVILVNDGSTDDTENIALQMGVKKIVTHPRNMGIGAARQSVTRFVKGSFIAYLSSDDVYHPKFLEKLSAFLAHDTATFTDYYMCNETLMPISIFKAPAFETQEEFRNLCMEWALKKNMFVNFSSIIVPQNVFSMIRFEEKLRHGEDLIFLLDTIIMGLKWTHIASPLLYYRLHGMQGTVKARQNAEEFNALWLCLKDRLTRLGMEKAKVDLSYWESFSHVYPDPLERCRRKMGTALKFIKRR